jgi:hypothetical protein
MVVYETSRIQIANSWLLRLWKRRELSDKARCKRVQTEKGGSILGASRPAENGSCEALSYEISSGDGDKEADRIMERKLVELRQPGFQGWVCSECGHVFVMRDCVLTGLTLNEITRHYKVMREQAFDKHRCPSP